MAYDFKTAELKQIYHYWSEKAGKRAMPSRRDLDPIIDIPQLTSNIWLVDVDHDPVMFRFRLLGEEVIRRYGADFTGKRLDEVDLGSRGEAIRSEYKQVVNSKKPVYSQHQIYIEETQTSLPYERIVMPLSDDGETVNMLLGGGYPLESMAE